MTVIEEAEGMGKEVLERGNEKEWLPIGSTCDLRLVRQCDSRFGGIWKEIERYERNKKDFGSYRPNIEKDWK